MIVQIHQFPITAGQKGNTSFFILCRIYFIFIPKHIDFIYIREREYRQNFIAGILCLSNLQ